MHVYMYVYVIYILYIFCFWKHGATILKNSIIIESLHNFYNEREVNHWLTHFSKRIFSKKLAKFSHHYNNHVDIPHVVSKAFRSPTIVISTVEISDCSISLLLHKSSSHHSSKEPLCDVVIASAELSCQCLEPEDCNGTDQRVVRYSNSVVTVIMLCWSSSQSVC